MRNGQAYQQKTEKIFVYEEKKFGRIDSWFEFNDRCVNSFEKTNTIQNCVELKNTFELNTFRTE